MKPRKILLKTELSDEELDSIGKQWRQERGFDLSIDDSNIAGIYLDDSFYDILISDENVDVYKPNGEPLILFRNNVLPASACKKAHTALKKAATEAGNRG